MQMKSPVRAGTLAALALAGLVLSAPVLHAQDSAGTDDEVFAPYPSRLRVGLRESSVYITWEDSPDVSGGYLVYRHASEPSPANFADAVMIGETADGVQAFEYTPPDNRPYYYIVLGRTPAGSALGGAYEVFIPLRNTSLVGVALESAAPPAAAPAPSPTTAAASTGPSTSATTTATTSTAPRPATAAAPGTQATVPAPAVSGLLARNDGDAIVLSFDAPGNPGRIVLYRATQPILESASLLDAAVAAIVEPSAGPHRDYPVPGIAYYYAAVPERELMGGQILILPGANATRIGAMVPAGSYRVGLPSATPTSRAMPLPFLVLSRGLSDAKPIIGEDLTPQPRTLTAQTEKAIASLVAAVGTGSGAAQPPVTIFPEDLSSPGGGEEYSLRLVVVGFLAKGLYAQAAEQFALYLSLPRTPANATRARFYRGQALAASGAYREAFFDLLRAQDAYYLETGPWMDFVLEKLHRQ